MEFTSWLSCLRFQSQYFIMSLPLFMQSIKKRKSVKLVHVQKKKIEICLWNKHLQRLQNKIIHLLALLTQQFITAWQVFSYGEVINHSIICFVGNGFNLVPQTVLVLIYLTGADKELTRSVSKLIQLYYVLISLSFSRIVFVLKYNAALCKAQC